jgi:hypothetical protein
MTTVRLDGLASLCGRCVVSIAAAEQVMGTTRQLIALWVRLGNAGGVGFRCAPDGWGLSIESEPATAADLGPYGHIEITEDHEARGEVLGVSALATPDATEPFGIRLLFRERRLLLIYNWGDELRVEQAPSPELEHVTYEPLCGEVM